MTRGLVSPLYYSYITFAYDLTPQANTRNLREALQRGDQTLARRYATLNLMKTKLRERAIGQLSSLDTLVSHV